MTSNLLHDNAGTTQFLTGSDGYDIFCISGKAADYGMDITSDGGIVVWHVASGAFDILYNIEKVQFLDAAFERQGNSLVACACDPVVPGTNNAPVAANDSYTVTAGVLQTIAVTSNDSDADGDALSITAINGVEMQAGWSTWVDGVGLVKVNDNGSLAVEAFNPGPFSFHYTITDGKGGSSTATVNGICQPATAPTNTRPVAIDDYLAADKGAPVTVNVLGNDSDADGDAISVSAINGVAMQAGWSTWVDGVGLVKVNANGTLSVEPVSGVDNVTFDYSITDGNGGTATANVCIDLNDKDVPATASIGDRVWLDANQNGVQDGGEAGVANVTVQLKDSNGNVIATQQTDASGNYLFDKLAAGNYQVGVTAPSQYELTAKDAFGNGADAIDSDVNVSTGHTDTITLREGEANRTVDAGLVEKVYNDGCIEGNLFAGQYKGEIARYPGVAEVIQNAKINLLDGSGNVVATTKADATGFYKFDGLGSGSYKVQIHSTSLELAMWNTSLAGINVHWMTDLRSNVALNEAGIFGDKAETLDSDVASVVKTDDSVMMRGKKVIVTTEEVHISGEACCVTIDAGFKTNITNDSPIMFDLNGDGEIGVTGETTSQDKVDISSIGDTVSFDLDGDGVNEQIEWSDGKGDGFLVDMTKIGADGAIDGSALFGDEGGKFANGYEKLALHDADGDGMLTGSELDNLAVWIDNGDGILFEDEMVSLSDAGVTSISTQMQMVTDEEGRGLMQSVAEINGETVLTEDVWFVEAAAVDAAHFQTECYDQVA